MSRGKRKIRNRQNNQNYKNFGREKDRKCDLKNSEIFFRRIPLIFFNFQRIKKKGFVKYSGKFFGNFKKIQKIMVIFRNFRKFQKNSKNYGNF